MTEKNEDKKIEKPAEKQNEELSKEELDKAVGGARTSDLSSLGGRDRTVAGTGRN